MSTETYRTSRRQELCDKQKAYYQSTKAERQAYRQKRLTEWIQWCYDWKSTIGCITCGEKNPVCLDFHHLDETTKLYDVPAMANYGDQKRLEEVVKCVVVCANCHRKTHAMDWANLAR